MKSIAPLSFAIILITALFACGKDGDGDDLPNSLPKDTLGIEWTKIQLDTNIMISDVFFVSNNVGFIVGHINGKDLYQKSTDGGNTWNNMNVSHDISPSNIYFFNATDGWIAGSNGILRTSNGGSTWTRVANFWCYDIHFITPSVGFAVEYFNIHKTTDGGVTWEKRSNNGGHGLFFLNENIGWTSGDSKIKKTTDGGLTFPETYVLGDKNYNYVLQFIDEQHGWSAGYQTAVSKTLDGKTWTPLLPFSGESDFQFFNKNLGVIQSGSKIYKTSDGGNTLNVIGTINEIRISEIHFTDENHGWAAGDDKVYRYVK